MRNNGEEGNYKINYLRGYPSMPISLSAFNKDIVIPCIECYIYIVNGI